MRSGYLGLCCWSMIIDDFLSRVNGVWGFSYICLAKSVSLSLYALLTFSSYTQLYNIILDYSLVKEIDNIDKCKIIFYCNVEKTLKANGTKAVFGHIIHELAELALNGIVLNINNQQIKVFLLMGLYEGDSRCLTFLKS